MSNAANDYPVIWAEMLAQQLGDMTDNYEAEVTARYSKEHLQYPIEQARYTNDMMDVRVARSLIFQFNEWRKSRE